MRLLYLPNERTEGDQIGPREAFRQLHGLGQLSAYLAYSYLVRGALANTHADALDEMMNVATKFQPDVILIQHTTNAYPMDRKYLQKLKALISEPKLVLYEEDPYGKYIKRIDDTLRNVLSESDMAILGGTGYLADLAHRAGAKTVRFAPHSYDSKRFDTDWIPSRTRKWDAVMIGNLTCLKRIPFLYMPGGRGRKLAAERLNRHLGNRFALYGAGQGWKNASYCNGPVPYARQGEVIRDAWMSINWGQFDEIGMYCSDRLPISLACGVPHITNYQPGYEHIYENVPGLFIIKAPAEATDVALYLLSLPIDARIQLGLDAAKYARENLHANVVYENIICSIQEKLMESE